MITAERGGFSVEEFIKIIQQDNSLEQSFNNLRQISYTYSNDIRFHNNKGAIKASYQSQNKQSYNGLCQWMEVLEESASGDYYNRFGNYNYYTSDLYDRVFYQSSIPCEKRAQVAKVSRAKKILERRIDELKKLIYTPGKEANIPLIGSKTAIFSEEMIEHYDFSLKSNGESYVFTATINPFYNQENPDGSVVKYLEVKMAKENFQVLSRKYKLQYNAGIYRFDILMMVALEKHDDLYIPVEIKYDGYWKIVGKRKENCTFRFNFIDFIE
ncbi:hypothetical protein GCM10007940_01390 [Portibacter lacus]|uniref:Uncharacterized protein n=2 Tax=Portibacter lacus TaxID=1099794 RepID=A0AA37WD43_9BACT|nr:hypothetical protein GCM10007940_01390 [Portibacter lacus]